MPGDGTRCVRGAARADGPIGSPVHRGPVMSSTFHLGLPDDADPAADFYGRPDNPTWRDYEAVVGDLDGGACVVFPSGMAAIAAVLRRFSAPGRRVLLPADGYFAARALAEQELVPLGFEIGYCPTPGDWNDAIVGFRPDLVLVETPSNPGLDVCDIAAVAASAHAAGALLAVDNTTCTALGQRPLELGADLTLSSDTKAMSGHGDLLLGHVSTDPDRANALRGDRTRGGAIPGPMETWLALRGLSTLELRLTRQAENAAALAGALRKHPAVRQVRWPGLVDDPAHPVARKQMRRWNGVVSFVLADVSSVSTFLDASSMVDSTTSFGGLATSADRRARWGDAVPEGLMRLSCGCEDTQDLLADVTQALDRVAH